jgi:hypothetical protein
VFLQLFRALEAWRLRETHTSVQTASVLLCFFMLTAYRSDPCLTVYVIWCDLAYSASLSRGVTTPAQVHRTQGPKVPSSRARNARILTTSDRPVTTMSLDGE